ncbi:MAG: class I SAM-dependent methyltransferase [Chloroflexia bacterium]
MNKNDMWANAEAYKAYVGRWSRVVAGEFLDWLSVPPDSAWLDVGCGTGALTETILRKAQPAEVTGIDPAEGFVSYAREHVRDGRALFRVCDATALPLEDETLGAVVAGLVLNHIPNHEAALAEMVRVAGRGGVVASYVWDYAEGMQMLRVFWDAAVELDPAAEERHQGRRYPICKPEPLSELFKNAGLTGVEVRAIDAKTHFRDFDDYWLPFLGGQGPAPGYVTSLAEEERAALRERIRSKLPVEPDGSISLVARAWAVRGRK